MEYGRYQLSAQENIYLIGDQRGLAFVGSPNTSLTEAERFIPGYQHLRPAPVQQFAQAASRIRAYWQGQVVDLTALPHFYCGGTDFQRSVWQALEAVPYGQTWSYQDLATKLGRPRAVRAVATAVARNPLLFVVPCQRIIRADGRLGQYRAGEARKRFLLTQEAQGWGQA